MKCFRFALAATGAAIALCAGCRRPPAAYAPPPPPEVTVATPVRRTIPDTLEFTGTTRAADRVEIRARVKGFLQKKHVQNGRRVKAGDLLFTIDPRTYDAEVAQMVAEVATREATLTLTEVTVKRMTDAAKAAAVSQQEVDKAIAERDVARSQRDLAQARLASARLDREFTEVRAPISGRIGSIPVFEGELVGANDATLLTTLVNDEVIYAMYDVDENTLLTARSRVDARRPDEDGRPQLVVGLAMAGEEGFPHKGRFDWSEPGVDPQTGTIRSEAIFQNPDGMLLPGLLVRLQVVLGERPALLVPDSAVQADFTGRFVLVVGTDNIVERRSVTVGGVVERQRVISSGLNGDERIIVNGVQRAIPGAPVNPKPAGAPQAAPAPPPGAPAGGKQG